VNRREEQEIVAAHADHLLDPRAGPPQTLTRHDQVQGLLDLAEHLQGLLVPMVPDANFRRRLHGELVLEAQRRQAEGSGHRMPEPTLFQQHRKGILIGAAAVGSVASVLGVTIAFVLRHRQGSATRIATG